MNHTTIKSMAAGQTVTCHHLAHFQKTIKLLAMSGDSRIIRAVLRAAGEGGTFKLHGSETLYKTSDESYICAGQKTWDNCYTLIVLKSRDPRCLWNDGIDTLYSALLQHPFETPLLPQWTPWIRDEMQKWNMIHSLDGFHPVGKRLSPELTPDRLDRLVASGVKGKGIAIA